MSRQIKFRGKRKDTGEWAYGSLIFDCDKKPMIFISGYSYTGLGFSGASYVDHDTVGQFTGLYDAKQEEIYEGDIISDGRNTHIVQYDEREAKFIALLKDAQLCHSKFKQFCDIPQSWINEFEKTVIGNIHDNPELLK